MKILLSYSRYFFDPAKEPKEHKHWGYSASILARTLYRLLSEIGDVTYVDGDNFQSVSGREFDLFVGIASHFSDILDVCKVKKSIFWAVNMHPYERNRLIIDFYKRLNLPKEALVGSDLVDAKGISASLQRADYILGVGNVETYNSYIRQGIPKNKIKILNYGVGKLPKTAVGGSIPPTRRFLYASSDIGLRKGFDLVYDLFVRAQERGINFRLDVVGNPMNPFYERKIKALEGALDGKMVYHGWVNSASSAYQEVFSHATYLVFPSLEEGQAGTVLDALRYGVIPLISSRAGIDFSPLGFLESEVDSPKNLEIIQQAANLPDSSVRNLQAKTRKYYSEFHESFETPLREALWGCVRDELYPKVSVIMPIFNKEKTILSNLRLLDSACRSYGNVEVHIIFDGCTDKTEKITRSFYHSRNKEKYPVTFEVTPNIFEVKTNNIGLKKATGKYCMIIQDDTYIYDRNALWESVIFLERDPTCAILGGLAGVNFYPIGTHLAGEGQIVMSDNEVYWRQDGRTDPSLKNKIFEVDACMRGPLFVRKDFLEEHGYLDEVYAPLYQDDMDLCFRARKFGKKVYAILLDVENTSLTMKSYDSQKSARFSEIVKRNTKIFYERWSPSTVKDYLWVHRTPLFSGCRYVDFGSIRAKVHHAWLRATGLSLFAGWKKSSLVRFLESVVGRVKSKAREIYYRKSLPHEVHYAVSTTRKKMLLRKALKESINLFLGVFGLEIRRKPDVEKRLPPPAVAESQKEKWLRKLDIGTVIDVGANEGQFAAEISRIIPGVRVISFEPLVDCYKKLLENGGRFPDFSAYNVALGDRKGKVKIYRSEFSPSSSLLPMGETHRRVWPFTAKTTLEEVKMARLDDIIKDNDIKGRLLIKIDVQGVEDKVIMGGRRTFSKACAVIIEVSFKEHLYKGQASFDQVYKLLRKFGFSYRGNWWQGEDPDDGAPLQANAIFIKDREVESW